MHSLEEDENAFVIALASGVEIAFACIGEDGGGGAKKWTKFIISALRRRAATVLPYVYDKKSTEYRRSPSIGLYRYE